MAPAGSTTPDKCQWFPSPGFDLDHACSGRPAKEKVPIIQHTCICLDLLTSDPYLHLKSSSLLSHLILPVPEPRFARPRSSDLARPDLRITSPVPRVNADRPPCIRSSVRSSDPISRLSSRGRDSLLSQNPPPRTARGMTPLADECLRQ